MHPEFLHFFNQCAADLRAYIGSVVRDVHAREDVFQDVSRTLWQSFDQYDPERSFGAWARGVATRKMLEVPVTQFHPDATSSARIISKSYRQS